VVPFTVAVGGETYPPLEDVYKEILFHANLHTIDALQLAKDAGAKITKNIVMLGALAGTGLLPFPSEILLETIIDNVPSKYKDINKKAFESGMKTFQNSRRKK